MRAAIVGAVLAAAASTAAAEDLPAPIEADTQKSLVACREAGGSPSLAPDYARTADLNGDGAPDYLIDLVGLTCENASSYFCGSAGCPVSVWLSGPGGYSVEWSGQARMSRIDREASHPAVVVSLHGQFCDPPRPGIDGCEERLDFAGRIADPPATEYARATGWTLRAIPNATPVAVADGPGNVKSVALFCLAGDPWLAATLRDPPAAETLRLDFAFGAGPAGGAARREPSAGGAYVMALRGQPLAGLLAGRDAEVPLAVGGEAQGILTLTGSSRAVRGALAACQSF